MGKILDIGIQIMLLLVLSILFGMACYDYFVNNNQPPNFNVLIIILLSLQIDLKLLQ